MSRKRGSFRKKTRYKFKKEYRDKGKVSISKYLQVLNKGDKVALKVEPAIQKGMYFPRFIGRTGIVLAKRGKCYEVRINDLGKEKTLIIHPIHLSRL